MTNNTNYLWWFLVLGVFTATLMWIFSPFPMEKKVTGNAAGILKPVALEKTIEAMIHQDKKVWKAAETLCSADSKIFFWYSKEACSSCTDNALTYLYSYAKRVKNGRGIVIITPQTDKKQQEYFSRRYNGLLTFIDSDAEWDTNTTHAINAVFFIADSRLKITDAHIFDIHNEKQNQLYFSKINILPENTDHKKLQ